MRVLLKVEIDNEHGNRALKEGKLQSTMKHLMETVRPEAAHFTIENGHRCAFIVFDMKDSSQLPVIGEPLYLNLGAKLTCTPCMNQEELTRGLEAWSKGPK